MHLPEMKVTADHLRRDAYLYAALCIKRHKRPLEALRA